MIEEHVQRANASGQLAAAAAAVAAAAAAAAAAAIVAQTKARAI